MMLLAREYLAPVHYVYTARHICQDVSLWVEVTRRADGYLTEAFTDSCVFNIQQVEVNEEDAQPYRLPAWRIAWQTGAAQDDEAEGAMAFGSPHVEDDTYIPGIGHLRADAPVGTSWQDKVFFLSSSGCYAIRATNVPVEGWGAGLYWAVYDPNGDGRPEADYAVERAYVWQFEKQ